MTATPIRRFTYPTDFPHHALHVDPPAVDERGVPIRVVRVRATGEAVAAIQRTMYGFGYKGRGPLARLSAFDLSSVKAVLAIIARKWAKMQPPEPGPFQRVIQRAGRALRILDAMEAGYTVQPSLEVTAWIVFRPDDSLAYAERYDTQLAAWEAAARHAETTSSPGE